jgi:hypothetical protein
MEPSDVRGSERSRRGRSCEPRDSRRTRGKWTLRGRDNEGVDFEKISGPLSYRCGT